MISITIVLNSLFGIQKRDKLNRLSNRDLDLSENQKTIQNVEEEESRGKMSGISHGVRG